MRYEERHEKYPDTVIISYPFQWGGQLRDRWMWMAELNGEVFDYHKKDVLIENALHEGYPVVVLRVHRGGTSSVLRHLTPRALDWLTRPQNLCRVHNIQYSGLACPACIASQ